MTAEINTPPGTRSAGPRLEVTAADSILARIDDVVAKARQRIIDEVSAYRNLSPADLADVTELCHSNFRQLAFAAAGHRVTREQLDYVGEHVRRRARSGIALEDVIDAYRVGQNVFWEECTAEVAARGLSRDAAVDLARKVSDAMDTLTTHAAAAYVREESYLRALGEKAARDLLDALLRGDVDSARVEPYNAAPGLDPQGDLVVVVSRVSVEDGSLAAALDEAAAALADTLATRRASALLVVRERAIVAVVAGDGQERRIERLTATREELRRSHRIRLYCGVSSKCGGFAEVASAYEQAALAVSHTSEERPVVSLAALPALQHLLVGATGSTRVQLRDKAYALTTLRPAALATAEQTLTAFGRADMNIAHAAADLQVHENTLRYRLQRIHMQTGHNPRTFAGLVELICLLEILRGEAEETDHGVRRTRPGSV